MRVSVLRYDFLHNSPSIIAGALYRNQDTIMTIDSFVSFSFDNSKETIIRSGVYHLKCNFRNTLNRLIILHAEHRFLCAISYTLKRFEPFNRRRRSLVHMKAKVSDTMDEPRDPKTLYISGDAMARFCQILET